MLPRPSLFINLLRFEIENRLWRLSSLVYFLVYLLIAFLTAISFAGAFNGTNVTLGRSDKLLLNSPIAIHYITSYIGYVGFLIVAPIFGQSINKDFENKFSEMLFATPLRKGYYFSVRYLGALLSSSCILCSIGTGIWIATLMPFVDRTLIGENNVWFYIAPYLTNVIPNTMIFGAAFIAVVSIFRKMAPVYVASVVIFTGGLVASALSGDLYLDNKLLCAMIEPLGLTATMEVTRYWSVSEQNTQIVPFTGVLLYNRLLWAAIGSAILALAYIAFDPFRLPKEQPKDSVDQNPPASHFGQLNLTPVALSPQSFTVIQHLTMSELKLAFSNVHFLMILLCALLYVLSTAPLVGTWNGTETLPVTYQVLEPVNGSFFLFIVILTSFYGGELAWKERDNHFFELVDSKPVLNSQLYLSQLFCLMLIQIFLAVLILLCCVLTQVWKGYFNFEWLVYFEHLFVYGLPQNLMLCVLVLFVHNLASHKYVGHFIVISYYLARITLSYLGMNHLLYWIGVSPYARYSDMNGFGTSAGPFLVFTLYWTLFHATLAMLTILLWRRGMVQPWKTRLSEFKRRSATRYKAGLALSISGFVIVGCFIFYNTNIINLYESPASLERNAVDYEMQFKYFENSAQPEIIAARIATDIYPETQTLRAAGESTYRNKTQSDISKVLLQLDKNVRVLKLCWSRPAKLTLQDDRLETRVYEFEKPLAPNEEVSLSYSVICEPHGFSNNEFSKKLVQNGSFFYDTDFAPQVGYMANKELAADKTRRRYGLKERPRMPGVNDAVAVRKTALSNQGTWMAFEATVSTSADQIAVAPGYLVKDWRQGDRHYFHYKMDRPILPMVAMLSARYAVARDRWHDVAIEVFYHPPHSRNVGRMIRAVKAGLDYYTRNFSPYQFRQFRIFEIPRYESFAQSFPNTVPFAESMGFIAKVRDKDPECFDYPFFVTSHELAHQWWGHQVAGGHVQGASMLSESLAEYSALMVQEKEYGPKQMRKFLKYELDHYLTGRGSEDKGELPLELDEGQDYIHYNKGSLVFYALKDYMGEDTVNRVLREYIRDIAFQQPPFTRAIDLVERFKKAATTPELKVLIEDLFERITIYDNRTDSIDCRKVENHYQVTIKGFSRKLRADEAGKEIELPMHELVDVGLFDQDNNILYLKKHIISTGNNEIRINVSSAPSKGGIDPLNKLIDKVSSDNLIPASAPER